jgi:hypothetical protein
LTEAKGPSAFRDELFSYIQRRYSENEKEEVANILKGLAGQRGGATEFMRQMTARYMDEKVDDLIGKMIGAGIQLNRQNREQGSPQKKDSERKLSRTTDQPRYVDADEISKKQAAIDAIRKERDSIGKGFQGGPAKKNFDPKVDPWHDVGTAGQGLPQKSQKLGFENPTSGTNQEIDIDAVKPHSEKDRAAPSRSGVVDSQKKVDRLTREKGVIPGDALARRLGVPTTADRTTVDEFGKENVAIWSTDRVMKFMDPDNRTDSSRVLDAQRYVDQVTKDKGAEVGGVLASRLGVPTTADRTTNGKVRILQPNEVEAITGGGEEKEKVRKDFFKKHDDSMFSREKLVAQGHIKQMGVSTDGSRPPEFPGSFHGQKSQFAGRSKEVRTMRPDQTTGRFTYGKRESDPSKQGPEWIWNKPENKWMTPSEFSAASASEAGKGLEDLPPAVRQSIIQQRLARQRNK